MEHNSSAERKKFVKEVVKDEFEKFLDDAFEDPRKSDILIEKQTDNDDIDAKHPQKRERC